MKSKAILVALLCLLCAVAAFGPAREGGQRRGQGGGGGRGQQPEQPPAMDKVTPEIPGVVKAGTKIEIVKFGLGGTDAGMGLSEAPYDMRVTGCEFTLVTGNSKVET